MPLPPDIAGKLNFPVHNILGFLEYLQTAINIKTADAAGDSESNGEFFGTIVSAKRNPKPFIIGLIPPDNAVNFIPVQSIGNQLTGVPTNNKPLTSATPRQSVTTKVRVGTENAGELPLTKKGVMIADLRKSVYNAYVKQANTAPSEPTLNLITAQILLEQGRALGTNSFPTNNFNLGNTEIPGHKGVYAPGYDNFKDRKAQKLVFNSPKVGVAQMPNPPSGGTYYLGDGYRGDNSAYVTYYSAFTNLDSAVNYQVNQLLRGWPESAAATTPEVYVDGLLHSSTGRAPYFGASPARYTKNLTTQLNDLNSGIAQGRYGGVIGDDGSAPPVQESTPIQSNEFVINIGDSTQAEVDPAGDRIGKNLKIDTNRLDVINKQTAALQRQIEMIRRTPALLLLVNPSEISRSYEQSVDSGSKGRYGNIVHTWLEKPFPISGSGVTAGQYVIGSDGSGGITNELRVFSASYHNLLSLQLIYKNNGVLYAGSEADPGIPILSYSIFIYYDNHLYIGSFDSFEVQDAGNKPFNLEYSFKFNVRYDIPVNNDNRLTDFEVSVVSSRVIGPPGAAL